MHLDNAVWKWVMAFLLSATSVGCSKVNQYVPPPPPQVDVATPLTDKVVDYIEFTGSTRATAMVQLRARVNGYLNSINFQDGAEVQQGDVLFVIDPKPYEAALAAAQASKKKAQASLGLAVADYDRTTPLVKRGALTEQELDVKRAGKETAEADVGAAEAAVTQAELNLSYTKIIAPISGRISRHQVDVGNLVQAEMTILTTIESVDSIHAYFNVSESDVLRLMELQRAEKDSTAAGQVVEMGLADDTTYPYRGTLDFSELGVDAGTGTQQRRGLFKNDDRSLVPGLFVRLRLPVGKPKSEILVAERAIAADQRGNYLLVVNEKNVVEYRPIKMGPAVGTMRVVADGLKNGEWVVVNGLQRARPGAPVDPQRQERMARKPSDPAGSAASETKPPEEPVNSNNKVETAAEANSSDAETLTSNSDEAISQ